MITDNLISAIKQGFPYHPTGDQQNLIKKLAQFLLPGGNTSLFILKGYAGTGKTAIVSSLVNVLPVLSQNAVLLAPTGRAAKVLSAYSGMPAVTIHKKIYRMETHGDGSIHIALQQNRHSDTLFIVDEASMIPWSTNQGQGSMFLGTNLLDDLVQYVYNGKNCRMICIGDTAQLPPVTSPDSPALNAAFLCQRFGLTTCEQELKDVVRQSADSGILYNATRIREMIAAQVTGFPRLRHEGMPDMVRVQGSEAAELVESAYLEHGREHSLVVCRSNKRANMYNQYIRQSLLFMEEEINAGDLLMVVRNNYFWPPGDNHTGFIANGDIIEIKRINKTEALYGFRFADITMRMIDYPDMHDMEVKILLNALHSGGPALSEKDNQALFDSVAGDFQDISNTSKRMLQIKNSPYLNALQVKYAYAMTCHKAQGGQWKHVFIDMGYPHNPDAGYLRWLYTAITRATDKVFLMNFTDHFFDQ